MLGKQRARGAGGSVLRSTVEFIYTVAALYMYKSMYHCNIGIIEERGKIYYRSV